MTLFFRLIAALSLGLALSGCGRIVGMNKLPQEVIDIIHAIDAGDHAELNNLLEAGAKPTPKGSPLSPLRAAITHFRNGKLVCDATALKLLLDHGADPNFVDQDSGFAALENALSMGDVECARLLKAAGADLNRHGKSGQSMLQFAVKGALRTGDTSILKLVLSWGVDPNVFGSSKYPDTALHEAVGSNWGKVDEAPIILELLRGGADPCIADRTGTTPLDLAVRRNRPISQKILEDAMRTCRKN